MRVVSIMLGQGDGSFLLAQSYAVGFNSSSDRNSVLVGDFNGDGHLDVAVINGGYFGDNMVSILLGQGDGTFLTPQRFVVGIYPTSMAAGDFNGDGHLDLALANGDMVSILLGNGDGTFEAAQNYATGAEPLAMAVGDFDGDGRLDLAVANFGGTVNVLLGNGDSTFHAARSYAVGGRCSSVALGDFDGDGHLDLAVNNDNYWSANQAPDTVSVLLGNGDGTFQAAQNYATGPNPHALAVGDFNGDGFPELAVASSPYFTSSGTVTVLLNAADWGRGPAPAPLGRDSPHRPVASKPRIEPAVAMLTAPKPQAESRFPLTCTDPQPSPLRHSPLEIETGQQDPTEAAFPETPMLTSRHAEDAVFERWGDGGFSTCWREPC
jgi:hypothetical protein